MVATITVRPTAGPLTWSGDPPSAPATMPPTTAAISPAATGAPEATAMPSDSGSATRKTTKEAGMSLPGVIRCLITLCVLVVT
jgi:hypothetical protein